MITRIVLATGQEISNISDVQEVIQNNGDYVKRALTINILTNKDSEALSLSKVEELFRAEGALKNIKVYKKDDNTEQNFEYLESEYTEYCSIQSIIKHSSSSMISVVLTIDPTDISGGKAKQLEQENETLKQQLAGLQSAMAELTMMLSTPQ